MFQIFFFFLFWGTFVMPLCEIYPLILKTHPLQVWKYSGTQKIPYGALEQIHMGVQTPEGQTQTDVLLTGGRNNSLRYR